MLILNQNLDYYSNEEILLLEDFINSVDNMVLGSIDGGAPRLAVVTGIKQHRLNEIFFSARVETTKVKNIKEKSNVELLFTDMYSEVIITGKASIVDDEIMKEVKYREWMDHFFRNGKDDVSYCLIKVETTSVRCVLSK